MRKLIIAGLIALLAIMMGVTAQAQNPTSGTAGPLTCKYDTSTKFLIISGMGDMPDYVVGRLPEQEIEAYELFP